MKGCWLFPFLVWLGLAWGQEVSARIYLVAVGISDYPGTKTDLRLPVNDAKTICWLYGKNSKAKMVKLLNDEATMDKILERMKGLFQQADEDDLVVFYFSGHGYQGGFKAYDGNLSYQRIRKAMAASRSKNKMIFADACYSGRIRTAKRVSNEGDAETKKANVLLFLSSRSNELSGEKAIMKNGIFTHSLQKGLRGGADANRDRRISAKELYEYVSKHVRMLSRDKQHPVMWGNFADDMPVMVW